MKYVVETQCENGNVFLHGPFGARATAEKYAREKYNVARYGSTTTHTIRAILSPTGWTKATKAKAA